MHEYPHNDTKCLKYNSTQVLVGAQAALRLRYARFLWKRKELDANAVAHALTFEKTPAYFDLAEPRVLACTVPDAKLLLMLRMPVARAISAYHMCKEDLQGNWCKQSFDDVLARALTSDISPRVSPTLQVGSHGQSLQCCVP